MGNLILGGLIVLCVLFLVVNVLLMLGCALIIKRDRQKSEELPELGLEAEFSIEGLRRELEACNDPHKLRLACLELTVLLKQQSLLFGQMAADEFEGMR